MTAVRCLGQSLLGSSEATDAREIGRNWKRALEWLRE